MDVHLLVYDLSQGLAQAMSRDLLGFQLDAIYHTSVKLNGLEYVYDGNVVTIIPGSSHLGQPLQDIHLGTTELPMDVIEEYLSSLREIYTVEAYDLLRHNCNNFSNDFATFLLGKGIPDHILNMPQQVLDSDLGRLLVQNFAHQVHANRRSGGILGIQGNAANYSVKPKIRPLHRKQVLDVTNLTELNDLLSTAEKSFAVVFFTSATCPPCRVLYPIYDRLAAEVGLKGILIKVDISKTFDVARQYSVSATPTIITFLHGKQENRWTGADPRALEGRVRLLVQMAWPPHPHQSLNLPTFANPNAKPVIFTKIPPLPKLLAKMGSPAGHPTVQGVKTFIERRSSDGPAEASLPDMRALTTFLRESLKALPPEHLFPLVDLLRCGLVDPRFSGFLAEESEHQTVVSLLDHVNTDVYPFPKETYPLRLVTLHMACNLFSSTLYADQILYSGTLRLRITRLIYNGFMEVGNKNIQIAAASLLYNVSLAISNMWRDGPNVVPIEDNLELVAQTLQVIHQQETLFPEALEGLLKALGYLVYCSRLDEVSDFLRTVDAKDTVLAKKKHFPSNVALIEEVGKELLGKGFMAD